jgi:hypothetical protein
MCLFGNYSFPLLQIKNSGKYKFLSLFPQFYWHQNKCPIVSSANKMKLKKTASLTLQCDIWIIEVYFGLLSSQFGILVGKQGSLGPSLYRIYLSEI